MEIIEVTNKSIDDCIRMRMELFPDLEKNYHKEELELIITDDRFADFIGCINHEPMALLELSFRNIVDGCLSSPVGYIEGIFIDKKYRGKNYGKRLIEFAEEFFRSRGCSEMASDAEIKNTASHKFHISCGFEETYRVVQFKKKL